MEKLTQSSEVSVFEDPSFHLAILGLTVIVGLLMAPSMSRHNR